MGISAVDILDMSMYVYLYSNFAQNTAASTCECVIVARPLIGVHEIRWSNIPQIRSCNCFVLFLITGLPYDHPHPSGSACKTLQWPTNVTSHSVCSCIHTTVSDHHHCSSQANICLLLQRLWGRSKPPFLPLLPSPSHHQHLCHLQGGQ